MAKLTIEGQTVTVDDAFLKMSNEEKNAAVEEIAASLPKRAVSHEAEGPPEAPFSTKKYIGNLADQAVEGLPIIGPLIKKGQAGIDAAATGITRAVGMQPSDQFSQAPDIATRYQENAAQAERRTKDFGETDPIASTAANIAGGILGTAPLVVAAPAAMGAVGTLPQMVTRGALSSGVIGGTDAAVRPDADVGTGAVVGGVVGAAAPLAGRVIGKVAQAFTPKAAPAPQNVIRVGDTDVQVRPSAVTGDAAQSANEQMVLRGSGPGQAIAQEFEEKTAAQMAQASDDIARGLRPGGAGPARLDPHEVGERVLADMTSAEQAQAALIATERDSTARQAAALRAGLDDRPVGGGQTVVETPYAAGERISGAVQTAAQEARAARTAAYRAFDDTPGEYAPAALGRPSVAIRGMLNAGDNPVVVTERLTPNTAEGLRYIDETLGQPRFENHAQTGELVLDATGRAVPRPITGRTVEEVRKQLTSLYADARNGARQTGNQSDVRGVQRLISAFDDHLVNVARAGGFSGDAAALAQARDTARAAHASYRNTFTPRGPGDDAGKAVEKIIGRYDGEALTPGAVAELSYGSASNPGGDKATKVARRLREVFGEQSENWTAYKQGLVQHLTETAEGTTARTPAQIAERIEKFLNGTHGRGLAEAALSPTEREGLRALARSQRRVARADGPGDNIDKEIAKLTGSGGNVPATPGEIVSKLFGSGIDDKPMNAKLALRLKRDLPAETWGDVQVAMFTKLTHKAEGSVADWGPQALANRIAKFLESDVSKVMFNTEQREKIRQLGKVYGQLVPVAGSTNPSGTAPMLERMAKRMTGNFFALLGGVQGGFAGLAVGAAADKAAKALANHRGKGAAQAAFYGPQAGRGPARTSKIPIILGGAVPAITNQ